MKSLKSISGLVTVAISGLLLLFGHLAAGAPVGSRQAAAAVRAWLRADGSPLQQSLGNRIQAVETFNNNAGESLYYVVYLEPAGFVIVAADDWVEPIVAFAGHGRFDPSPENPLGALVSNDLPGRIAKARGLRAAAPEGPFLKARNKWKQLEQLDQAAPEAVLGLGTVSDVRVPPFIQSRWSQDILQSGAACYNYYTPPYGASSPDNYPCGCSATAMAQLMRYYQHPVAGVGTAYFDITVDGVPEMLSLRGGDGYGGAYIWANMPLVPGSASDAQRQAIGALTHDAGLTLNMDYAYDGSASDILDAKTALIQTFGYSSGVKGYNNGYDLGTGLTRMINPNMDAKYPVLLGITGSIGGHAVVCDGYGDNLGTLYHHLNLGWAGYDDAWYALPTIDTSQGTFTSVTKCVYNVYVTGTGEIISGRVVNPDDTPLANATVTATRTGGGTYTATTDPNGIYALVKVPSSSQYNLSVTKAGYAVTNRTVSTGTSIDNQGVSGNIWGADFTLPLNSSGPPVIFQQPASQSVMAGDTATFSVVVSGSAPFFYQWQGNGTNLIGQTSDSLVLAGVTQSQAGSYRVIVSNSFGSVTSQVATLTIALELTQSFTSPAISINHYGTASPYPSAIEVSGLGGVIVKATVTLSNLTHTWPDDLDILLVGPRGQKLMLMSDAGYGYGLAGVTLIFDDAAAGFLPDNAQISAGPCRPSAYEPGDVLSSPAPAGPYATNLSVFNGTDPNGTWQLFVYDDSSGDSGSVANGWTLRLTVAAQNQAVDHYAWTAISSPQPVNTPFSVSLAAQDSANRTLTNYGGLVNLSASAEAAGHYIRGNVAHDYSDSPGTFTDGYAFTPSTNLVVMHVRHYYGEKVSIWTDAGVLLASEIVKSVPGTWVETPLAKPLTLTAGTRYRIGTFYNSNTVSYFRSVLPTTFAHGTIDQSYYSSRDRFPATTDTYHYLVDIRYSLAVPVAPVSSGPLVNGVWTGTVTVPGAASNVVLRAEDAYGRFGMSTPFDVSGSGSPPVITTQPQPIQPVRVGDNVTLLVVASGPPPLSYQWRKDGAHISGATNTAYPILNVQTNDAGLYSVVVTNRYGTAISSNVNLQVLQLRFGVAPGSLQWSNGVFRLRLLDLWQGGTVVIETSTNLVNWTPIFTNSTPTNVLFYTDPTARRPYRFFRAVER